MEASECLYRYRCLRTQVLKLELINFINSWGQDKVMFGTDFPIIDFERATREVEALGFREVSKEKLMWKNAARLYGLKVNDGS